MTQADRDRLVTLKKAKKKLITQREAGEELGLSVRHVKRLIHALKKHGEFRNVGFGTFHVVKRAASIGRNPRTGEQINIPASKQVKFKAGAGLKASVN